MIDEKQIVEYNFIEVNGATGIKFNSGEFKDVILTLSEVSVQDDGTDNPDGNAVLSFNYDVVYDAEKPTELFQTVEFKDTVGDILLDIIMKSVENTIESESTNIEESSL
jgi:hypothetical protein